MAINKVIDRNNNVLIDLSNDTVKPKDVLVNKTFHDASGNLKYGIMPDTSNNNGDFTKYRFYDYDGTLMYSFTDEEIDAMTELPAGPDHTDDNLTFQEWNWTLEDLKSVNRNRTSRPIVGANLITSDGKTYLEVLVAKNSTLVITLGCGTSIYPRSLSTGGGTYKIDWGDGSESENSLGQAYPNREETHQYTEEGLYIVTIEFLFKDPTTPNLGILNITYKNGYITVKNMKIGKLHFLYELCSANSTNINFVFTKLNIPDMQCLSFGQYMSRTPHLPFVTIPRNILGNNGTWGNYSANTGPLGELNIRILSLPKIFNKTEKNSSVYSFSLRFIGEVYLSEDLFSLIPTTHSLSIFGNSSSYYYKHFEKDFYLEIPNFNITKTLDIALYYGLNSVSSTATIDILCNSDLINLTTGMAYLDNSFRGDINLNFAEDCKLNNLYFGSYRAYDFRTLKFPKVNALKSLSSIYYSTIDLTNNDFLPIGSSISLYGAKILVPSELLDKYKSASYWSNVADYIYGV